MAVRIKPPRIAVVKNYLKVVQWSTPAPGIGRRWIYNEPLSKDCNFHNSSKLFIRAAEWGHRRRYKKVKNQRSGKSTGSNMEEVASSSLTHHQGLPPQPQQVGAFGNNWARRHCWEASWQALTSAEKSFWEDSWQQKIRLRRQEQSKSVSANNTHPCLVIPLQEKGWLLVGSSGGFSASKTSPYLHSTDCSWWQSHTTPELTSRSWSLYVGKYLPFNFWWHISGTFCKMKYILFF